MFHHDLSHTGYSTSTARNTNNTIWNYTTGDLVFSSPAVADGMVFVGSYDGKVYCLNASTGAYIWSYTTGHYVGSSPAVADSKVYVGSYDDKVYAFGPVHDVAVTNVTPLCVWGRVRQGSSLSINVTVENQGDFPETFNVTVYYNETAITLPDGKNYTTITLTSGNSTTITLTWNTTGVALGNYIITARATPVPGETDIADNTFIDGIVTIVTRGGRKGPGVPLLK